MGNRTESVDIVLKKIARGYGVSLSLLVFVGLSGGAGYFLYSAHTGLCALITAKAESIVDPVARELMLGNPEQADEVFTLFQTSISRVANSSSLQLVLSHGTNTADSRNSCTPSIFSVDVAIPLNFGKKYYGSITGAASYFSLKLGLSIAIALIIAVFISLQLFSFALIRRIRSTVLSPIERLSKGIELSDREMSTISEVVDIHQNITNLTRQVLEAETDRMILKSKEEIANLSLQVAHDIRSPLTALRVAVGRASELPSAQTEIIRTAIRRIDGIANELLSRNRVFQAKGSCAPSATFGVLDSAFPEASSEARPSDDLPPIKVSDAIRSVVFQKKIELNERNDLVLKALISPSAEACLANVNADVFERVISNLLNNSIDSISMSVEISVACELLDDELRISVVDNGKGMSEEVVSALASRGGSYNKPNGNGFGISHARASVESWNGRFSIMSRLGRGTKVIIALKAAASS